MAGQLRKDDVGSVLRLSVKENALPFDASAATVKTLKLSPPNGNVIERAASFETTGADGVLIYTTIAGDLDQAGPWTGQLYLEFPTGKWHTDPFNFVVGENLSV
jgi:hypothetical protein